MGGGAIDTATRHHICPGSVHDSPFLPLFPSRMWLLRTSSPCSGAKGSRPHWRRTELKQTSAVPPCSRSGPCPTRMTCGLMSMHTRYWSLSDLRTGGESVWKLLPALCEREHCRSQFMAADEASLQRILADNPSLQREQFLARDSKSQSSALTHSSCTAP